ncbi:MAG: peptide deformylase [Actinobacteria bacterium]|nr:peptide deformylase [Actinomycetota bacterium]MDQ3531690.1 peptide deformylase [Actinomycetota bacterium]
MAILRIRTWGDPVLRQPARPVERVARVHRRLIEDMIDTMRHAPGVGLAAPQVGVSERIFVWEHEGEAGAVINPTVVSLAGEPIDDEEGCLSIPGIFYPVARSEVARIEGTGVDGRPLDLEGKGFLARILQHETDHLDGVLFLDRLSPEDRREALSRLREQALGLPPRSVAPDRGGNGAMDGETL